MANPFPTTSGNGGFLMWMYRYKHRYQPIFVIFLHICIGPIVETGAILTTNFISILLPFVSGGGAEEIGYVAFVWSCDVCNFTVKVWVYYLNRECTLKSTKTYQCYSFKRDARDTLKWQIQSFILALRNLENIEMYSCVTRIVWNKLSCCNLEILKRTRH